MKIFKNKKVLIGIGVAIVAIILCILAVLSFRKNPYSGKQSIDRFYYNKPAGVKKEDTDSGTFESGIKWNSVQYTMKGFILYVTRYQNRSVENGVAKTGKLKDKTIKGVAYKYSEEKLDEEFTLKRYYTQVENDTYAIMAVYKTSKENDEKLEEFLSSIIIQK